MAVVPAGSVAVSIGGKVLTFTDETTGLGAIISRTLDIYGSQNTIIQSYDMGENLTQDYDITADGYFKFVETITDEDDQVYTVTKKKLAQGIVTATFLNIIKDAGCACDCAKSVLISLAISDLFIFAANAFAVPGNSISAQDNINAANKYLVGV